MLAVLAVAKHTLAEKLVLGVADAAELRVHSAEGATQNVTREHGVCRSTNLARVNCF
jgi:hypothetical protein